MSKSADVGQQNAKESLPISPEIGSIAKNDARNSRLSVGGLRKNNEEVLRGALRAEAQKQCESTFRAFGECAKQSGLWVVVSCREQNRAMSACMDEHFNEDIFKKYLADNGYPPPKQPRKLIDLEKIQGMFKQNK